MVFQKILFCWEYLVINLFHIQDYQSQVDGQYGDQLVLPEKDTKVHVHVQYMYCSIIVTFQYQAHTM